MDRITFFKTISGIKYPEMLIEFYDQFLALNQILYNVSSCTIAVIGSTDRSISFGIKTNDSNLSDYLLNTKGTVIYGRAISIYPEHLSDTEIKLTIQ